MRIFGKVLQPIRYSRSLFSYCKNRRYSTTLCLNYHHTRNGGWRIMRYITARAYSSKMDKRHAPNALQASKSNTVSNCLSKPKICSILPVALLKSSEPSFNVMLIPFNISCDNSESNTKRALDTLAMIRAHSRQIEAFTENLIDAEPKKLTAGQDTFGTPKKTETPKSEVSNIAGGAEKNQDAITLYDNLERLIKEQENVGKVGQLDSTKKPTNVIDWKRTEKQYMAQVTDNNNDKLKQMAISSMQLAFDMDIANLKDAIMMSTINKDLDALKKKDAKSWLNPGERHLEMEPSQAVKTIPLNFSALIQGTVQIDPSRLSSEGLNDQMPEYNENVTTIAANIYSSALQKNFPADIGRMSYSTTAKCSDGDKGKSTDKVNPHIVCVREGVKGCESPGNKDKPFFKPKGVKSTDADKQFFENKCEEPKKKTPKKSQPSKTPLLSSSAIIGDYSARGLMSCKAYARALIEASKRREALAKAKIKADKSKGCGDNKKIKAQGKKKKGPSSEDICKKKPMPVPCTDKVRKRDTCKQKDRCWRPKYSDRNKPANRDDPCHKSRKPNTCPKTGHKCDSAGKEEGPKCEPQKTEAKSKDKCAPEKKKSKVSLKQQSSKGSLKLSSSKGSSSKDSGKCGPKKSKSKASLHKKNAKTSLKLSGSKSTMKCGPKDKMKKSGSKSSMKKNKKKNKSKKSKRNNSKVSFVCGKKDGGYKKKAKKLQAKKGKGKKQAACGDQNNTAPNCEGRNKTKDVKTSKRCYSTSVIMDYEQGIAVARRYGTVTIGALRRSFSSKKRRGSKRRDLADTSKCEKITDSRKRVRKDILNDEPKQCFPQQQCPKVLCKDPSRTACAQSKLFKERKKQIAEIRKGKKKENEKLAVRCYSTSCHDRRNINTTATNDKQNRNDNDPGDGTSHQIAQMCENETVKICGPCAVEKVYTEIPAFSDYDVLIRVEAVALSGSDVHYYETGGKSYPGMTLGHDAAGIVEQAGKCVTHLKPGDRVAMEAGLSCGICDFCKRGDYNICSHIIYNGFLSKYQVHPADLCHKLPDCVSMDQGALAQTLAVGCQACFKARVTPATNVLIIGSCPTAVSAALCARAIGAKRICMLCTMRNILQSVHEHFAIDYVLFDPDSSYKHILEAIHGAIECPHVVINCATSEKTMNIAVMSLQACGTCVLVECDCECACFNALDVLMKNINIVPSFRSTNMFPTAITLLACGQAPIGELITKTYHWCQVGMAFRAALNESNVGNKKVIVRCAEEDNSKETKT